MAPTLYYLPPSPAVRAVLMCAKTIGIDLNLKLVDLVKGEHLQPAYLKINPQHTVPTLEDDDGFIVWDSHAIMGYLVNMYSMDESLYPSDAKLRAIVDQRLHFDSNVLFIKGLMISKTIIFEGAKEVTEEQRKTIQEAFEFVEKFLEKGPYVAGEHLTIADFSFVTSITSWSVYEPIDPAKYPRISAWLEKMEALPYYDTTNKPGLDMFKAIIPAKLAENNAK